jgi:hypothetical protein
MLYVVTGKQTMIATEAEAAREEDTPAHAGMESARRQKRGAPLWRALTQPVVVRTYRHGRVRLRQLVARDAQLVLPLADQPLLPREFAERVIWHQAIEPRFGRDDLRGWSDRLLNRVCWRWLAEGSEVASPEESDRTLEEFQSAVAGYLRGVDERARRATERASGPVLDAQRRHAALFRASEAFSRPPAVHGSALRMVEQYNRMNERVNEAVRLQTEMANRMGLSTLDAVLRHAERATRSAADHWSGPSLAAMPGVGPLRWPTSTSGCSVSASAARSSAPRCSASRWRPHSGSPRSPTRCMAGGSGQWSAPLSR